MSSIKVKLTLAIDKKSNQVLFAEADKDFVDILFNILSLPIGTVIKLLNEHETNILGSPDNLYDSLANLDESYLQSNQMKPYLLKSQVTASVLHAPLMLTQGSPNPNNSGSGSGSCGEGIVKESFTYVVMDDLSVKPASVTLGIDILKHDMKKGDLDQLEMRVVELNNDMILDLLYASLSLRSCTVLTDVFLNWAKYD